MGTFITGCGLACLLSAAVMGALMWRAPEMHEAEDGMRYGPDPRWQHPAFQPWHGREPC
jgi:hypothetical protein